MFKTTSKIFDKAGRQQGFTNLISKNSREFKRSTQEKMEKGFRSGRLYKRKGGNFRRSHRASARGQRPAPDTGTLVKAIRQEATGPFTAKVDIAEKVNPANGQLASKYGAILQAQGRPIMSESDVAEAQRKLNTEAEALIKTVI